MKRAIALSVVIAALALISLPVLGATTLEVVWMGWPKNLVDAQIEGFRKAYPDIPVDIQLVPFNQLFQTLEVRLASGHAPDVFIVDGPLTASYATRGYLLPLDDVFTETELAAWFPSSVAACRWNGRLYAAPYATSSVGLYFNKTIFRKYGVALPSENPGERLTWEQAAELARKLTIDENHDGQPDTWGLILEQSDRPYQILPLAESRGARALSADGAVSEGYITSPAFIEAATFYSKLFNEWKVSPKGLLEAPVAREYFGCGKAAMMLGAEWNISRLAAFKDWEFGLAPHPYFAGGRAVTPTGGWNVGIGSRTANRDAAVRFLKFITGRDASIAWTKLFGNAPARRDVYAALPDVFKNPMWQVLLHEMDTTASPRPVTPGYLQYESILKDAFNAIQFGADPASTLESAARQIDRDLAKYR
ncbi:MAG: extracellular solute-binding protein [Clostridia bacterium]|nr:extracellular solute-binding protein [Clostridia bacterium]